ncbi:uncharacterized protein LOC62_02G002500 [Vanrija pseudolonga]|uniref:Uncharacterized protein n=1 Tax=Vanrija pseudolonga TaxID=143232 RepID=A0AAF0Y3W6_9TREE|nr:hypothetical protein LOC62_02G002500 [Vanrija pseudolonga]
MSAPSTPTLGGSPTTSTFPSASPSAFPSAAPSSASPTNNVGNGGGGSSSSNTFYHNLFYILIAVLGAFGVVSFINLMRTRRRRRLVLGEADRLGLMVPGMPGYVPLRDRAALLQADGWRLPEWWEIVDKHSVERVEQDKEGTPGEKGSTETEGAVAHVRAAAGADDAPPATTTMSADAGVVAPSPSSSSAHPLPPAYEAETETYSGLIEVPELSDLHPLALIPVPEVIDEPAKPWSPIPYFPNYVSYPKTLHNPKKKRFGQGVEPAYDTLLGEPIDVVVAVRMPARPIPSSGDDGDEDVINEWGGLELGVTSLSVSKGAEDSARSSSH